MAELLAAPELWIGLALIMGLVLFATRGGNSKKMEGTPRAGDA